MELTLKKQPGLGSGRKKVSPVAGAGRGHSSETRSPQTTYTYSAVRLHEHQITTLPTIHFLHITFFIILLLTQSKIRAKSFPTPHYQPE